MYNDQLLNDWLDKRADEIVAQMGTGSPLKTDDMLVLVLKAQTNHFNHLDVELRQDMRQLREDVAQDIKLLREDMDKRFEQVDKRFEQVDKRFEQVDRRFDTLIGRMDRFMAWSFATTLSVGGIVIAAGKFW